MFVRRHKPPKKFWRLCRFGDELSLKAEYYLNQSIKRYCKDVDQAKLYSAMKNMRPEIGFYEGFRFVVSK